MANESDNEYADRLREIVHDDHANTTGREIARQALARHALRMEQEKDD
ncbi:MAG: hypothetical protein ACRDTG_14185 [Pseudonocardiaceae bacterium]